MATTPDNLSGWLLVASPHLLDPNFRRTVILLLDHTDDGAFGVVLNRPLPVEIATVLPGWQDVVSAPSGVFQGGPVGLDGAIGVATLAPGSLPSPSVDPMTGPFALVDLEAEPGAVVGIAAGLRIFAGHSGWGAGQLEAEIESNAWYVLPADPQDAMTPTPEALWRTVMRRQGGGLAIIANYPPDIHLN